MLHTSYLDETDVGRYPCEVWWTHSNTLWQHKCNKHIQKYSNAFQNKAHPHQIPFFEGTSNIKEHQAAICWDPREDCKPISTPMTTGCKLSKDDESK